MNRLIQAMEGIGDDLILSALEGVAPAPRREREGRVRVYRPGRLSRGGVRVRVAALAAGALMLCAALVIWAAVALTGSHSEDPRAHGEQKLFSSFSEVQAYYPDAEMAIGLARLVQVSQIDGEGVQLYYVPGTAWQESANWNSLLLMGTTGEGNVFMVYCLFERTVQQWLDARPAYEGAATEQVGDTQVYRAVQELVLGEADSWALFEANGVVYEVLTANDRDCAVSTGVLELLLGD